jgi:target of EGR1 protein 1
MGLAPKSTSKVDTSKPYCVQYAVCSIVSLKNHGVCNNGKSCAKSHDIDLILDHLMGSQEPKMKKIKIVEDNTKQERGINVPSKAKSLFEQDHSACYDAYMTGFVFAHQMQVHENILTIARNKIYLIGKQIPLIIEKSRYAKPSKEHLKKASLYAIE